MTTRASAYVPDRVGHLSLAAFVDGDDGTLVVRVGDVGCIVRMSGADRDRAAELLVKAAGVLRMPSEGEA